MGWSALTQNIWQPGNSHGDPSESQSAYMQATGFLRRAMDAGTRISGQMLWRQVYMCRPFPGREAAEYVSLKDVQIPPTGWDEECSGRPWKPRSHQRWRGTSLHFFGCQTLVSAVVPAGSGFTPWSFPLLKFHPLGCHLSLVVWTGLGPGGGQWHLKGFYRVSSNDMCPAGEGRGGVDEQNENSATI